MKPNSEPVSLTLHISAGEDSDADQLDQLTRQFAAEIGELEVDSVDLMRHGVVPPGAKAAELVTLGGLAVTLLPTVIPKLIELVSTWSQRGVGRIVKIKIQRGDDVVEVEYSPSVMSPTELVDVVVRLMGTRAEAEEKG